MYETPNHITSIFFAVKNKDMKLKNMKLIIVIKNERKCTGL